MATSGDYQISFRVEPQLKREFELALVLRAFRTEKKATAVSVLTAMLHEFIDEENRLRK